jgi:hypothetical protein
MTGAELKAKAIKLYGEEQWKFALAAALKCDQVTVWRYSKQAEVPFLVASKMKALETPLMRKKT